MSCFPLSLLCKVGILKWKSSQSLLAYFSRKVKGSCVYFHAFFNKQLQALSILINRQSRTSYFELTWSPMCFEMQGKSKYTSLFQVVWPKSQHFEVKVPNITTPSIPHIFEFSCLKLTLLNIPYNFSLHDKRQLCLYDH